MKTIDIPGGQATLRDVADLTVKQRRLVQASTLMTARRFAQMPDEVRQAAAKAVVDGKTSGPESQEERLQGLLNLLPATKEEAQVMLSSQDDCIIAFLASWTLGLPLPTTAEMVENLPGALYDALAEAIMPAVGEVIGAPSADFSVVPDTEENKEAPFVDSEPSAEPSATPI